MVLRHHEQQGFLEEGLGVEPRVLDRGGYDRKVQIPLDDRLDQGGWGSGSGTGR